MHLGQGDTIRVLFSSIPAICHLRMNSGNPSQLIILHEVDEEISHVLSRDRPPYVFGGYSRITRRFRGGISRGS